MPEPARRGRYQSDKHGPALWAPEILRGNRTSQSVIMLQYAKHQTGTQSRDTIGDGTDPGERKVREGMQGKRPHEQSGIKNMGGALAGIPNG